MKDSSSSLAVGGRPPSFIPSSSEGWWIPARPQPALRRWPTFPRPYRSKFSGLLIVVENHLATVAVDSFQPLRRCWPCSWWRKFRFEKCLTNCCLLRLSYYCYCQSYYSGQDCCILLDYCYCYYCYYYYSFSCSSALRSCRRSQICGLCVLWTPSNTPGNVYCCSRSRKTCCFLWLASSTRKPVQIVVILDSVDWAAWSLERVRGKRTYLRLCWN